MNKVFYVNENYRIMGKNISVTEGGMSRNIAFMHWVKTNVPELEEIKLGDNRFANLLKVFGILLMKKNIKIIFQYTTVGVPLHNIKIAGRIISALFLKAIKKSTKFNELIFDVSDLKYEQCLSLELNEDKIEVVKKFEEVFFKTRAQFIFASEAMREYACNKYLIPLKNTDVCINGGTEILKKYDIKDIEEEYINCNKILFVYAGTLNKGRQIEEMISSFPNDNKSILLLMGSGGAWLHDFTKNKNIHYLGALEEEKAHYIVSMCDVGLIPYSSDRLYYNLAYPTKLSFYITAGIPFLSTSVQEVINIHKKYDIGYILDNKNWKQFFYDVSKQDIENKKTKINEIKSKFYWNAIFSANKFI